MINGKKVLGIIPARGNSKRVKNKNIRIINGIPLIYWTFEACKNSKYIDRLIVSTDSLKIKNISLSFGVEVPFLRPKELAEDSSSTIDTVLHTIEIIEGFNYIVLLQPTSPLRILKDIDFCIEKCDYNNHSSVVSITKTNNVTNLTYLLNKNNKLQKIYNNVKNRQLYNLNGAVYVSDIDRFKNYKDFIMKDTVGYVMSNERSLDIDTEDDLNLFKKILKNESKKKYKKFL